MGTSGVPEVVNGANVGFTDFSEFSVGAGLPSGITAFGIGNDSPTAVAIASDPDEGNYFEMTGHGTGAWGFGLDAFDSQMEFGEMLVRVFCSVENGRRIVGCANTMSGFVGSPTPDIDFEGSGAMRRLDSADPDGISTATQVLNGSGGEISGAAMQEAFQQDTWIWVRCRRVENPDVHTNHDDWEITAWYGAFEDEPTSVDGSSQDRTRVVLTGPAAVGWAITANGTTNEQRIAFLSFTNDPDLAAPPEPGALDELPETVTPMMVSDLWSAGALRDKSPSGLIQTRNTLLAGWMFEITWPLLSVRNVDHQEISTFLHTAWQRGRIFNARHPLQPGSGLPPNGLGSSGVAINGAGQAVRSDSINTDGWPVSNANVVRAGDAIKIDGDSGVYIVTASASSSSSGEATLEITPPLRKVPDDDAAVETTDIFFRVVMFDRSKLEQSRLPQSAQGPKVTFLEALT